MDHPFAELHGKHIEARQSTELDALLLLQGVIIEKYENRGMQDPEAVGKVYADVKQSLDGIDLTDDGLTRVVQARSVYDYTGQASMVWGVYTGALLTALAQRKRDKGLQPYFAFDGANGTYDNLFSNARGIGTLLLYNLHGDSICSNVAQEKPHRDITILCSDIMGDNLCSDASADILFGNNITGNHTFSNSKIRDNDQAMIVATYVAGHYALAGVTAARLALGAHIHGSKTLERVNHSTVAIALDITGNNTLANGGVSEYSTVHLMIGKDIRGSDALANVASMDCNVDIIYADDIQGDNVLKEAVSHHSRAKRVIAGNIQGKNLLAEAGTHNEVRQVSSHMPSMEMNYTGLLDRVYLYQNKGSGHLDGARAEHVIRVQDQQQYQGLLNTYSLTTIVKLAESVRFEPRMANWEAMRGVCTRIVDLAKAAGTQRGVRFPRKWKSIFSPVPIKRSA